MDPEHPSDGDDAPEGVFDRPLWRIWIPLMLLPAAVQAGGMGFMAWTSTESVLAVVPYALGALGLLGAAVWIFRGTPALPGFGGDD